MEGPFSNAEIASANDLFDNILSTDEVTAGSRATRFNDFYDPELLGLAQNPALEDIAKAVLRTSDVVFNCMAITRTHPAPGEEFRASPHVDNRYTLTDWQATPRGMLVSIFIWLTDVTMNRAPMMIFPGSHLQMARHFEAHPGEVNEMPVDKDEIPEFPLSEPQYLCIRAGQITVLTTGTVHGATANTGTRDRRVLAVSFMARSAPVPFSSVTEERSDYRKFYRDLLQYLRPERRHLVPEVSA